MAMNIDASVNINADVQGQQAVDKLSESIKRMGTQGTMSAAQLQNAMRMVPPQLTDIATQLAGGQSPFLIMMQQGGQLRDMFGSVTGALSGVARTLLGMVTPFTVLGGVAAAFGAAAYLGAKQSEELNKQILFTGGAAGYTAGQIEKMASTLRDTAGISAGTARELTTGLAASGVFVGKNLDAASEAAAKFQKLTGQSSDEVVKDFATMSKGVASWAAQHNEKFNYLSVAQFKHIKQLEDMGRGEEALKANIEALDKALADRKQNLGTLETAWNAITRAASAAWDAMLNIGREETPEAKLDKMKAKLAEMAAAGGMRKGWFGEMIIDPEGDGALFNQEFMKLKGEIDKLQATVDASQKAAADKAKEAAKVRKEIRRIENGDASAEQNAALNLQLEQLKGASEREVQALEAKGQKVENQYRAGLITEQDYNDKKLTIAKAVLQEKMLLTEQEMALEKRRPGDKPIDAEQRAIKLQALRNQMAQLVADSDAATLKAEGDRAAFLRAMDEAVAKFKRTQQARVDQIRGEADAVNLSTLEQKKRAEALRIDKEAADAAMGKSQEFRDAIMAEAEAQKKATADALAYADAKARSFDTGAKSAFKDYIENVNNAATQSKNLFTNAFKGMEDALVDFVKTGQLDFSKLADSIITDLIRIQVQRNVMGPLVEGLSGGGLSGAYDSLKSMLGFANGGIMTGSGSVPLQTYASGGVAKSPQLAVFGEGKTPEAYVPLPDGRNIPVKMQGAGAGGNVTVNVVNNASGSKATTSERQGADGSRIIDVMIEQVKASIAADISRGVGTVTSALERTYGANRAAGAY